MRQIFLLNIFLVLSTNLFSQAVNSVLDTGSWYKIAVPADGVYKLTYQDLITLGIQAGSIDPHLIRLFGNGGGMLPTQNNIPRIPDLREVAIKVIGESDGSFDTNDYILFYGQSQHRWKYDSLEQRFRNIINVYSDTTYYFLNTELYPGARIPEEPSLTQTATHNFTSFDELQFHELDSINFLHGGREWYGEHFGVASPSRNFQFTIPDLDLAAPVRIFTELLGRSFTNLIQFQMTTPAGIKLIEIPTTINSVTADYAKVDRDSTQFIPSSSSFTLTYNFLNTDSSDSGWLNRIEVMARRNLIMSGSTMFFRDLNTVGIGNTTSFTVANATSDSVWDVTDHNGVKEILRIPGTSERRVSTWTPKEFVCFNDASLPSPFLIGPIPNQNLRALPTTQMLIITPSEFLSAANDIAAHHISYDGLSVNVAEINQIYNEFSSGSQDLTAIHDFISMFYHRAQIPDSFKYVLLLGDASYDYKYRIPGNTNFVPCFETASSLNITTCYSSDEYIAYMDSSEGESDFMPASVDLGIGRLPARNLAEADIMVNKIIHYATNSFFGDWRKHYIFCADDEDNNISINQAEILNGILDTAYCEYDLEKVYVDAFHQDTVPYGWRYPEVRALLRERFDDGFLYFNFNHWTGISWITNERIIDVAFIDSIQNLDHMPFLAVFGDEFNTFDEPEDTSGGERFLLNPSGGAIGCFSGSNINFSGSSFSLNQKFNNYILASSDEMRLGDICMKAKRDYADRYTRNFVLLGDPALRLKYPENKIVLTDFNGGQISADVDTLPLGSTISASGEVQSEQGQLLSSFNGPLNILLLRELPDTTLANDVFSIVQEFDTWNDTLYDGTVNVNSGVFNFVFTIPSNGSQYYRSAKLSLYSENGITDATGCHDKMLIGNIFYSVSEQESLMNALTISPNPATSDVEIKLITPHDFPLQFSLFDPQGRNVITIGNIQQNPFHFNCEKIARGIYFISLENGKSKMIGRGKLIVR